MSYQSLDFSRSGGRPVHCYKFISGSEEFFLTSAETDITVLGDLYLKTSIEHSEPQSEEDNTGQISITVSDDEPVFEFFLNGPAVPIDVTIYRVQRDALTEPVILWMGQVVNSDTSLPEATLVCDPVMGQFDLEVPTVLSQREYCAWTTGDPDTCGVDLSLFTFEGEVTDISANGLEVTVDGAAAFGGADANYFKDGVLKFGSFEIGIEKQTGDVMTIYTPMRVLAISDTVEVIAGDDRTPQTCRDKFNNVANILVFHRKPVINVYYGPGLRI